MRTANSLPPFLACKQVFLPSDPLTSGLRLRSVLPLMLCFIPAFLLLGIVPTVVSAVTSALTL